MLVENVKIYNWETFDSVSSEIWEFFVMQHYCSKPELKDEARIWIFQNWNEKWPESILILKIQILSSQFLFFELFQLFSQILSFLQVIPFGLLKFCRPPNFSSFLILLLSFKLLKTLNKSLPHILFLSSFFFLASFLRPLKFSTGFFTLYVTGHIQNN